MPVGKRAVIVGGGPAGLVTALALRRIGWTVTVVDAARPPIDKACGEGLLPQGVQALRSLGVHVDHVPHADLAGIRFLNGGQSAVGHFNGVGGMGIRRTDLHALLVHSAEDAGVTLLWGEVAQGISGGEVHLRGQSLPTDLIVGADGANSRVRQWAGLARGHSTHRFGFRQHFLLPPWSREVEVYWCSLGQAYITPVASDKVGVAWITDSPTTTLSDMLAELPMLADRLGAATPESGRRGALSGTHRLSRVTTMSVALVGEASGSVDAVTGDGLTLASLQATALAECVQRGELHAYNREHAVVMRQARRMSNALVWMGRHTWLRQRVMCALHGQPNVFDQLLNLHAGAKLSAKKARTAAPASLANWIGAAAAFARPPHKDMVRKGGLEPPRGLPARS